MAQTFDTSRVGGGTYELEQDANGNYKLKSVGFAQVNKLNLPDLATSDTTAATTTPKTEDKKIEVADPFLKLGTQNTGGGEGGGQDYSGVMLKSPEVKDVSVRDAGESMTKIDTGKTDGKFLASGAAGGASLQGDKASDPFLASGAAGGARLPSQVREQKPGMLSTPQQQQQTFAARTTGLQKPKSVVTDLKNLASKSLVFNAVKGAAQGLGAFLGAIAPEETNSQIHAKTYFNASQVGAQAQRISGNPANDLFAGANRNARELDGYGQKRIDTITKTISKMTPAQKAKSSLPARKEKFEKQQREYREDRAAAKDKASGNTKTNVREFGKTGLGRDTSQGGGDTGQSSGGKIVCTMMNESYGFGSFRNKIWMKFHGDIAPEYQKGYHKLFLPLVNYAKQKGITNKIIKNILEHIAVHSTIDMRQALRGKRHLLGRVYRKVILPLCYWAGRK